MNFDIETLYKTPSTKIVLWLPTGKKREKLVAFMKQGSFAVNGSSNYDTLFNKNIQEVLFQSMGRAGEFMQETTSKLTGSKMGSLNATRLAWMSSESPEFSLELLFIAIRKDDDVTKSALTLLEGTYPTTGLKDSDLSKGLTETILENTVIEAPWGMTSGTDKRVAVSIGSWFYATRQILKSVTFNFSQECIESGLPLYAEGSITFAPDRMIDAREFRAYFSSPIK